MPDSEKQLIKILPRKIKSMRQLDEAKIEIKRKMNRRSLGLFAGLKRRRLQNKLNRLNTKKINTLRLGAEGEVIMVSRLKKLSNDFHVLCGIDIRLPKYIKYRGKINLRSAQMDVVVVGPTGLFVIEVKNWTDGTNAHKQSFTPYEQADRAATVLNYATNMPVVPIVGAVKGNIERTNGFGVTVCDLDTLNQTITGMRPGCRQLGRKDVNNVVKRIRKVSR